MKRLQCQVMNGWMCEISLGHCRGFCQEELHKRLIGQDDAVRVLAQASLECVEPSEAADFEILL